MKEAVSIKAIWLGNNIPFEVIQNEIRQLDQSKKPRNHLLENLSVKL